MSIYMSTTKVSPERTAGQVMEKLAKLGAGGTMIEYGKDGEVQSLSFYVMYNEQRMCFSLPVKWEPVLAAMERDRGTARHLCKEDQARRTAWRLALRWIEAQLAMIDVGIVDAAEVFLPYLTIKGGQTLYEHALSNDFKGLGLPAPGGE